MKPKKKLIEIAEIILSEVSSNNSFDEILSIDYENQKLYKTLYNSIVEMYGRKDSAKYHLSKLIDYLYKTDTNTYSNLKSILKVFKEEKIDNINTKMDLIILCLAFCESKEDSENRIVRNI